MGQMMFISEATCSIVVTGLVYNLHACSLSTWLMVFNMLLFLDSAQKILQNTTELVNSETIDVLATTPFR